MPRTYEFEALSHLSRACHGGDSKTVVNVLHDLGILLSAMTICSLRGILAGVGVFRETRLRVVTYRQKYIKNCNNEQNSSATYIHWTCCNS